MDETISTLRIEIDASTDAAQKKVDNFSRSVKRLRGSTRHNILINTSSVDRAVKKVDLFSKTLSALKRIAFYRLIRTAIKDIGKAFQEGAQNAYWYSKTMGDQTKYIAQAYDTLASKSFTMQNQLGAAFATLKATITPILIEIINLIRQAADAITQLFALLGGHSTYLRATEYTKDWADATAGGAKAAKEWRNQLMGFDEINRLEEPSDSGGGGGGGAPDYSKMFEEAPINDKLKEIVDTIKNHLIELELFAGGMLLGLGLMLVATGANVPLGLGLMVAGAYVLAKTISENWGWITENIKNVLSSIEMIAAGFLFGIGLILTLTGANIPLGIGLMVVGLAAAATIAALSWDEIPDKLKEVIGKIDIIIGSGLIAIGAVLLFATPAFSPLGLALIIAGLAFTAAGIALNWDHIPDKISAVLQTIALIVGGALLAVGALLAFSGANIPLGIGLMLAGGLAVGGAIAVNWDAISEKLRSVFSSITSMIKERFGYILEAAKQFVEGVKNIFKGLTDFLKGAFAGNWKQAWEGIVNIFRGIANAIQSVVTMIIGFVQQIISAVQSAISAVGSLFSLSGGGGTRASARFPSFATGGFPEDGLFFANSTELIGRFANGKTAVANNEEITAGIAKACYDAFTAAVATIGSFGGGGDGDRHAEFVLNINGREFARAIFDDQQAVTKERGSSYLVSA